MDICMIPAYRISKKGRPELRVYAPLGGKFILKMYRNGLCVRKQEFMLKEQEECHRILPDSFPEAGMYHIQMCLTDQAGLTEEKCIEYQVIDSAAASTTVIDGLWISIYHWSEFEGQLFNGELKKLSDADWKKQIYDMNEVGIKGVVIQNLFLCNEYVNQHDMTAETYRGKAFYDSGLYGERVEISAKDPVRAILEAASECGMHVFLGVGHYAWFDFSRESLEWHKNVTKELYDLYGGYESLYGWYVSEEIMGDFYYSYPPVPDGFVSQIIDFFAEYTRFVRKLTPAKPVAFAPNNIRFEVYEKEWRQVLPHIDILLPFAFARDLEHSNILEIKRICDACDTHLWVDMEVFRFPIEHGLVPKSGEELITEIRSYDDVEQIFGYQYTGLMSHPENEISVGGKAAEDLYVEYGRYYRTVTGIREEAGAGVEKNQ